MQKEITPKQIERVKFGYLQGWPITETNTYSKVSVTRVSYYYTKFRQEGLTPNSETIQKLLCAKKLDGSCLQDTKREL